MAFLWNWIANTKLLNADAIDASNLPDFRHTFEGLWTFPRRPYTFPRERTNNEEYYFNL